MLYMPCDQLLCHPTLIKNNAKDLAMDLRSIMMGVSFSIIWSSAFTSARILVTAASPLMVLSLRFLISGLLGTALAYMLRQENSVEQGRVVSGGDNRYLPECPLPRL